MRQQFVGKIGRTISSQCSAGILPAELVKWVKPCGLSAAADALHRFFRQTPLLSSPSQPHRFFFEAAALLFVVGFGFKDLT